MLGERVLKPPPQEWLRANSGPGRSLDVFVRTTHLYVRCFFFKLELFMFSMSMHDEFMFTSVVLRMLGAHGSSCTMKRILAVEVKRWRRP